LTQPYGRVRAHKSSDYGKTWTFAGTVSMNQTRADKPTMCVDASDHSAEMGTIYVIWHNDQAVYINRLYGPGGTWRRPVQVSGPESTGTRIGADIQVNSGG
jgi:hypothetical protein